MADPWNSSAVSGVRNPILLVTSAGRGLTPDCPEAVFRRGDVVKVRRRKALLHFPRQLIVACAVPPGFSASYALADMLGENRPLMVAKPHRGVSYILVAEGDPKPYLAAERDLLPTGEQPVEIGSVSRASADTSEQSDRTREGS